LELSEEDSRRCALFEVPEGKVSGTSRDDDEMEINFGLFSLLLFFFSSAVNSITYIHLPVGSKWLYVGTEKGNIHIVHTDSFTLSGYIIHWNKAVEL
jgi:hypothetical protein